MTPPEDGPLEVHAHHLDFAYARRQVLHDIDLRVSSHERLGIVGESGSGKSTLAKLLVGLIHSAGVTVNGRPWADVRRSDSLRRRVQLIQQDPFASLTPHVTAQSSVAEAARVTRRLPAKEAAAVAEELLTRVGMNRSVSSRRPGRLSGGQCQRVAIARALATGPGLLIADEPTSALDLSVQAQIINLFLDIMNADRLGFVLISHDLAVVRHLTDRLIVMQGGRIVEQGATVEVLSAPSHPYTKTLVGSMN
ncbi:ABC transporter ATP-binding protein [Streptomyces scopuliridis]|uniref:ABC transporter ATP-binding protein n=1 Tax=Streptomyces scopuliridis TaxID=452529 RepID=UPI00369734F8